MRRSDAREYRLASTAQAVVSTQGSQPILATTVVAISADARSCARSILGTRAGIGLPDLVLADAGFASAESVPALEAQNIALLVAIGRTQAQAP
jgi:hypothetical protein